MTQTTTSPATTSTPTTLEATRFWQEATPEQRALLEQDRAYALSTDLPEAEYLEALQEWGGTVADYLAENQVPADDDTVLEQECAQPDPDSVARAQAEALVAAQTALEQTGGPSLAEYVGEQVVQAQATAQEQTALEVSEGQQEAVAKAQADQEEAREEAVATLQACVKAHRRGERAWREGMLEAGRLGRRYLGQRMALGDKRDAAVMQLVAQLGMWASHRVDRAYVNDLLAVHGAYECLAVATGLDKAPAKGKPAPADAVPYGHYREAWGLLVTRVHKDTAEESYALLPGVEEQCLALFRQCVADGLSRDAVVEKCQGLVRVQQAKLAQAKAEEAKAAAEAKARADQEAAAKAKALRDAQEEARAAEVKAQEALASEVQDEARAQEALEQHQQATAKAEEARKQAEAADQAQQQKAREEARAKQEAQEASKRQAEAEAKAKAKADKQARKAGEDKPATVKQPAPESRPGQNLLATAKQATARDAGHMAAALVQGHPEPLDVLRALVLELLDNPPQGVTPEEVAQATLRALAKFKADMDPVTQRALTAAAFVLAKPQAPAQEQPAAPPAEQTAAA